MSVCDMLPPINTFILLQETHCLTTTFNMQFQMSAIVAMVYEAMCSFEPCAIIKFAVVIYM